MNTLPTDDSTVAAEKARDCRNRDERPLELIVLGDAVQETKQASQYPLWFDSAYGVGARD